MSMSLPYFSYFSSTEIMSSIDSVSDYQELMSKFPLVRFCVEQLMNHYLGSAVCDVCTLPANAGSFTRDRKKVEPKQWIYQFVRSFPTMEESERDTVNDIFNYMRLLVLHFRSTDLLLFNPSDLLKDHRGFLCVSDDKDEMTKLMHYRNFMRFAKMLCKNGKPLAKGSMLRIVGRVVDGTIPITGGAASKATRRREELYSYYTETSPRKRSAASMVSDDEDDVRSTVSDLTLSSRESNSGFAKRARVVVPRKGRKQAIAPTVTESDFMDAFYVLSDEDDNSLSSSQFSVPFFAAAHATVSLSDDELNGALESIVQFPDDEDFIALVEDENLLDLFEL
jgi:hypothetical protein